LNDAVTTDPLERELLREQLSEDAEHVLGDARVDDERPTLDLAVEAPVVHPQE
jgi:hypothetical protein